MFQQNKYRRGYQHNVILECGHFTKAMKSEILDSLNKRGIQARSTWKPLCHMKPYAHYETYYIETAIDLYDSLICLPNGVIN